MRRSDDECAADLFARIEEAVKEGGGLLDGQVTVGALAAWLCSQEGLAVRLEAQTDEGFELLVDAISSELRVLEAQSAGVFATAAFEAPAEGVDEEQQTEEIAQNVLYGWPRVEDDPVGARQPGRFPKAFPLDFPMGVGDLHDERSRDVNPHEWAQHLLRFSDGRFVRGFRGHRLVWAIVNTVLLSEAAGKGFVVHRNVMRRLGGRVVGGAVLRKADLREMLESEEVLRSMMYQLMSVGRDVRSTPMQWSYEGKKLDCAMKHISWRPPWVEGDEGEEDAAALLLGENSRVEDLVGLGRMAAAWFTLNCKYNAAFDIHRLNAEVEGASLAVDPGSTAGDQHRFQFIRDAPDIAAFMVALRTECTCG